MLNYIPKARRVLLDMLNDHWSQNTEHAGLAGWPLNLVFTLKSYCKSHCACLTGALYSRDRWSFAHQWPGPVWCPRRQHRPGFLPGQRPVSDHQTVLRSVDQEAASRDTLLQRLLRPGNHQSNCNPLQRWFDFFKRCHMFSCRRSERSRILLGVLFSIMSLSLVDCAARQFCFPGTDIHSDRSTFWRVSKFDSQSLDVWQTVHLLQVGVMGSVSPTIMRRLTGLIPILLIGIN